jgi:membrane-associated phospholipid phosphatase
MRAHFYIFLGKNQARALHTSAAMETVRWLHQLLGGRAHPLFLGITYLGSSAFLWPVILLWYWLFDPRLARRLGLVLGMSIVINQLLKTAVGSSRPYDLEEGLASETARRTGMGHGFPSGHTQNTATFWPSIALCLRRRWLWGLAAFLIITVGVSRLALGVHLPGDVIGGAVFGLVIAWIGSRMPARPGRSENAPRSAWAPLPVIAGLGISFLGAIRPEALALLVAFLLVRPEFSPPRSWRRRLMMAAGGIACVGLAGFLLLWLPEKAVATWAIAPAVAYLGALAVAWVALAGWPRLWMRWGSVRS